MQMIITALALAASVSALQVQYPAEQSSLDLTKKNTIKWASVSTDPSSFDIYLVNGAVSPTVNKLIASNVKTSSDSYTLDQTDVPTGKGYQINLESNDPENTGILAQSGQFSVVDAGASTTSASFTATTATDVTTTTSTSTGSSTTATTTFTTSPSSSASSSGSSSASSSSSSSSSSARSSASGVSASSTSANASGANASSTSTQGAAAKLSVSTGATGLVLGLLALLM